MRELATIRKIGGLSPIPNADRIEVAQVDGWNCVVPKGKYEVGESIIYIEVDSFLPQGEPRWEHLMKGGQMTEFNSVVGHVLKPAEFKKVLSRGLVIPVLGFEIGFELGQDMSELLGITKYEKPIPEDWLLKSNGYTSYAIPTTALERIENRTDQWDELKMRHWEVTEKLHGTAITYRWENGEFGASYSSSRLDFNLDSEVPACVWARKAGLAERLKLNTTRNMAIQGELIGPGICGNYYRLDEHRFYVYDIYDLDEGQYLRPEVRNALVGKFGLISVPEKAKEARLDHWVDTPAELLEYVAVEASRVNPLKLVEGWVFKTIDGKRKDFKVISPKFKG